jgi:hypothetical protein
MIVITVATWSTVGTLCSSRADSGGAWWTCSLSVSIGHNFGGEVEPGAIGVRRAQVITKKKRTIHGDTLHLRGENIVVPLP